MPSKRKRREFYMHLSSYVIVIGMLGCVNLATADSFVEDAWFLWPATAWGIGLTFHFASLFEEVIPPGKWHDLSWHVVSYLIVMGGLGLMNLMTSDYPWVIWPALAWGAGLAIHIMSLVFNAGSSDEEETQEKQPQELEEQLKKAARVQHKEEKKRTREEKRAGAKAKPAEVIPTPVIADSPAEPLTSRTVQAHLDRARAYQSQINTMLRAARDPNTRVRLQELATQMNELRRLRPWPAGWTIFNAIP